MDLYGKPVGGGISYDTLPRQITNLTATAGTDGTTGFIGVSFSEVPSTSWSLLKSYVITYKAGSVPTGPFDGTRITVSKVSAGSTRTQRISGLMFDQLYGIRLFPLSVKNRYQTSITGATATATPVAGIRLDSLMASIEVDRIKLKENGSNVQFLVLKHNYENSGRTLVCRKWIYNTQAYDAGNSNEYNGSDVDVWLNQTYLNIFTSNIREKINSITFPYSVGRQHTVTTLARKIFLLSGTENGISYDPSMNIEGTIIPYFSIRENRFGYLETDQATAIAYYTRSPDADSYNYAFVVDSTSSRAWTLVKNSYGIRPAFTLPPDMLFNPTPDPDGCYIPL